MGIMCKCDRGAHEIRHGGRMSFPASRPLRSLCVVVPLRRHPHVSILLIVFQQSADLFLDLARQAVQIGGPCVAAIGALHHDDRAALYDDHASAVMALRTDDRKRVVGIRHAEVTAILMQRFCTLKGRVS